MVLVAAGRGFPSVCSKCGSFSAQICTRAFACDGALDSDLFLLQRISVLSLERPSLTPIQRNRQNKVLYILIFKSLDSRLEDKKDSAPKDSKHSLTSICS